MRLCNIGNQQPVELLHLLRTIEGCLGRPADIRLLPMQAGDVYETSRPRGSAEGNYRVPPAILYRRRRYKGSW